MTIKYERVVREITIKPVGKPIFDELATSIRIDDEASGPFLVVSQCRDDSRSGHGCNRFILGQRHIGEPDH